MLSGLITDIPITNPMKILAPTTGISVLTASFKTGKASNIQCAKSPAQNENKMQLE